MELIEGKDYRVGNNCVYVSDRLKNDGYTEGTPTHKAIWKLADKYGHVHYTNDKFICMKDEKHSTF